MATLILQTYPATLSESGPLQVIFALDGRPDPFPRRLVEIKRTADAIAALEAYKAEAAGAGVPCVVSMRLKDDGSRSPAGFKAASRTPPYHRVNI